MTARCARPKSLNKYLNVNPDNFDTFGDSDGNKKFTRVSELQSPDHKMLASQGNNNPLVKRNQ